MEILKDYRVGLMVGVISSVIVVACVFPALNATSRVPEPAALAPSGAAPPDERAAYVAAVLRESRTGLPEAVEVRLADIIVEESLANDLDPLLVMALIKTESTFYNWARSHKGAKGLMQIMPETGRWLAEELEIDWAGDGTLFDPYHNVRLGIRYYSHLKDRYGDDAALALAAYNAGPTRLSRHMRRGRKPPERYARKVLASYRDFKEKAALN